MITIKPHAIVFVETKRMQKHYISVIHTSGIINSAEASERKINLPDFGWIENIIFIRIVHQKIRMIYVSFVPSRIDICCVFIGLFASKINYVKIKTES